MEKNKFQRFAFWSLLVAGLLLWGSNWWWPRPLFIDESNLARNLFDRSFRELFLPLDYQQYAPPLYLVLAKACGELFGYGERALRLPALLGGASTILSLALAGRRLQLGPWGLLAIALLFVNPTALRYVTELKPYALDLGISSLLILLALTWPKPTGRWALVGSLAIWCSLPAVFVLAVIPLPYLYRGNRQTWLQWGGVIACWLASFVVLYWTVLQPSIGKSLLTTFHAPYFFPLPFREYFSLEQVARLLLEQPKLAFGFTAFAIAWGLGMSLLGGWSAARKIRVLMLLPLLIVFAVSSLEKYSLIPRLLLFSLPGWWLLATLGTKSLWEKLKDKPYRAYLLLAGWGIVLLGSNVVRHYASPLTFSDARRLTTDLTPGYQSVLHDSAVPGYDYYRRIHPETANQDTIFTAARLQDQVLPGSYVVLYDVLTKEKTRQEIKRDSTWAARRGATEIRVEHLYRSARLYVVLPEAN